ncbi:MAG: S4 domain-containing protein, partial [candidate division Zixibacteria bacterium]|nr:S4 domain-containing protein [candidate division Zixibacteria bacterium]
KRRTVAKEMASNGLVEVNGHRVKAAYLVRFVMLSSLKGAIRLQPRYLPSPQARLPNPTGRNISKKSKGS